MTQKKLFIASLAFFIIAIFSVFAQDVTATKADRDKLQQFAEKYYSNDDNYNRDTEDYKISKDLRRKDPGYVYLVIRSRSLATIEDKQYWLNLYAIMTPEQIDKAYDIFMREAKKIAAIEEKYERKKIVAEEKLIKKMEETSESNINSQSSIDVSKSTNNKKKNIENKQSIIIENNKLDETIAVQTIMSDSIKPKQAANTETINTQEISHYVILIDASGSMRGNEQTVINILNNQIGNKISPKNGDFISIIPFGIGSDKKSFQNHFYKDRAILMKQYNKGILGSFANRITSGFFTGNWTGLSMIDERALYLFNNTSEYINQMFFITISDDQYNGSNPINEIESMSKMGIVGKNEVINEINGFNKFYYIEQITSEQIDKVFVRVGRLVPAGINNIDINSIANFPAIKDKAVEVFRYNTGYKLNFVSEQKKCDYQILNISYTLKEKGAVVKSVSLPASEYFSYTFNNTNAGDYILETSFSVLYKDSIYGKLVLLPNDIRGLNKSYELNFEKKKNILLIFPMSDFMFRTAGNIGFLNQDNAIAFWNILILIVSLLVTVYLIVRYVKKNKINKDSNNVIIS